MITSPLRAATPRKTGSLNRASQFRKILYATYAPNQDKKIVLSDNRCTSPTIAVVHLCASPSGRSTLPSSCASFEGYDQGRGVKSRPDLLARSVVATR